MVICGRSLLSREGWLVSSCGVCSKDSIRTTGSRCKRLDRESVGSEFTSPVRTGCFTWRHGQRGPEGIYVLRAFEKKTQKTSAADLKIGRERFRGLEKSRQQDGKERRS